MHRIARAVLSLFLAACGGFASAPAIAAAPPPGGQPNAGPPFKIAGVNLGVDNTATVHQSIVARGASETAFGRDQRGLWGVFAREGNYTDVDRRIFSVGCDGGAVDAGGYVLIETAAAAERSGQIQRANDARKQQL